MTLSIDSALETPPTPVAADSAPRPVYDLVPVIHRLRDVAVGGQLSELLAVVEAEVLRLRGDVDALYDDWFIETCAEWVVPYIGDLLGVQGLRTVPGGVLSQRALVANTIRYRRRKGTPGVLEQVARDVTNWPARVVEYFQLLATTQHLDHVRPQAPATADLRDSGGLSRVGTAFERTTRTADVRHIDIRRGRHNLPSIGLYLWRLSAYRIEAVEPRRVGGGWTFDPAGRDIPLFHPGRTETPDLGHLAQEPDVPAPLGRRDLLDDLRAAVPAFVTATDPAFRVSLAADDPQGRPLSRSEMISADLTDWRRPPADSPASVAIDPVLGRLTVREGLAPSRILVDYAYGAPGDLGAGPHDRREVLGQALATTDLAPSAGPVSWTIQVSKYGESVPGRTVPTIGTALALWQSRPNPEPGETGVIVVADSATYDEKTFDVRIPLGTRLVIVAAALPATAVQNPDLDDIALTARGVRPHLVGDITVTGADGGGELLLDGLSVEGTVQVAPGDLGRLVVSDCTLTSGWISAVGNEHLVVTALRTIAAGLDLAHGSRAQLSGAILYADTARPAMNLPDGSLEIDDSTLFGGTAARMLTASNSILGGRVVVGHRQEGCIRFCSVAPESQTPRRYHVSQAAPTYTSVRPGDPAFGQLAADCPAAVTTGADDGGELGVFHVLQQSVRIANLRSQLDQYLRFGLETGVFFAT